MSDAVKLNFFIDRKMYDTVKSFIDNTCVLGMSDEVLLKELNLTKYDLNVLIEFSNKLNSVFKKQYKKRYVK